ncbi:MAG: hypothetical protein K9N06_08130 [Candidatus Cloacimonetes bacterium]|nr:hypothetical protein [Candidatus Cloacimonadota bacterium]
MKVAGFLFLILTISILGAVSYNWQDNEYTEGLQIISESSQGLEYTYSASEFSLEDIEINGVIKKEIVINADFLPNNEGNPDLPAISRMIAMPRGAKAEVTYTWLKEEIFEGIDLAPAPRIPWETEDYLEYNYSKIYENNALYPEEMIIVSEPDVIRGVDYIIVSVHPFRYNPQTRELHYYRDIKVSVSFSGGDGYIGEERLRSRWWDPVLRSNLLNWASLPEIDYSNRTGGMRTPDYEYLIITPTSEAFTTWADSIKIFRAQQGIRTGVVTLTETGSSNTQIENYINNAYNTWDIPPVAVLFLGDYGTNASNTINSPTWDNYCISDNLFADITGNDLPDLSTARITARNEAELELMIHKFLDYERNPPTNTGFYQNPVVAGGWQTERWFILCTEVVRGFWANVLDKTPVREYAIYSGTPGTSWSSATNTSTVVNYFGANGLGYLGASPAVVPNWNATAASINNDINNGCFMLQHRDHGGETGWGEPDYGNGNLGGLDNEDLSFIFSTNCLTGKFNWSGESFAEAFHRLARGALGINAATEVSYSFVNDVYVWGTYDYMWPDFDPGHGADAENSILPCFANSSGKWYLQASNWPYNTNNKEVTYYLFHHHGDAFMTVFTEIPQTIAVSHDDVLLSGMTYVEITAENGSFICLSVNGEILATAEGSGIPQQLQIEPQDPLTQVHLVVTKQDHYRYETNMLVIPPEGAYAVVNDVTVSTPDDDIIEYNETVNLSIQIENFGNENATGLSISLSCNDVFITLIDNLETAALVNANSIIQLADAFSFSVDSDIPDGHDFYLTALVNSDQGSWESTINLTGYAPVPLMGNLTITGDANNNGRLDPGEVASLNVEIVNEGGSELYNVESLLQESDPYCTILQNAETIPEINAYDSAVFTWRLEVSETAEIGHVIAFDLECNAEFGFSITTSFALTVGLCLEDFESGGFNSYEWSMTGNYGWNIAGNSFEGAYCAQSETITHNQSAGLEVELNVLSPEQISFYYKVSSESGYDYLRFYIDGTQMGAWCGSVDWTQFSTAVSTGIHTFSWIYQKDSSVSSGSDCAWIDYIVFPPINIPQPAQMLLNEDEFSFNLLPQATGSSQLQIANVGGSDLQWSLSRNYVISRESGGPDNYGYQWLDSNEAGGPDFNWIDISQTGTQIIMTHNDLGEGPFPIGFTFNFYGVDYEEFIVNANGWLGFGDDNNAWSNAAIPDADAPRPAIMGFWDDLYPAIGASGEGEVYYQNFDDHLVVMFDNVQHYPGTYNGNYTFEMIIYASGEMLLQYDNVSGTTNSSTIGIQNANASDALQVVYNSNYVENDLAIRILRVVDWLELSQTSGNIPISGNTTVTITVDTEDLEIGDYLCNLLLNSNDPQQQTMLIPVNLFVGGEIAYGDIDDNGAVEAFDAALVLQYFVGFNPPAAPLPWQIWRQLRADVDGNSNIEAYDASLIQQYSVGLINTFPVEIPQRIPDFRKGVISNENHQNTD